MYIKEYIIKEILAYHFYGSNTHKMFILTQNPLP